MKRKDFLKKGLAGAGGIVALSAAIGFGKTKGEISPSAEANCESSPKETRGPFPNKTPADYVRENIIGDRKGIALLINLKVVDQSKGCNPLGAALVDIWHCDNQGNYSEYGGYRMQETDLTREHFLRGRQSTDAKGEVSFISIFPGYYPGRAPHLHLEIFSADKTSLLVTQIAFPESICNTVYTTQNYQGTDYVKNTRDNVFGSSLKRNMADSVSGNNSEGYILEKTIVVAS